MKRLVLLLMGSVIITYGWSQSEELMPEQKFRLIDSMIATWYKHGLFNGGILINQRGTVVYQRHAGYVNFEKMVLNTDSTSYNLASISKPFTAIAILQLVHKKKLKLANSLVQYSRFSVSCRNYNTFAIDNF